MTEIRAPYSVFQLEVPLERVTEIDHIPGWCDGRIMKRLQELAEGLGTIVNIGAWKGKSCAALAQKCSGLVWAIDSWRGSPDEVDKDHVQARDNPLSVYWEFCRYMAYFGLLGTRVIPITGDSASVCRYFSKESIDLVFVDGGHDFDSVWVDLVSWTGRVKRDGGVLCGDDYNWPGVNKAVNRFHKEYTNIYRLGELKIEVEDKFWVMRRK